MDTTSAALAELQRLPCFAGIPVEEIAPLVPVVVFRVFDPQQRIITEGEEGEHLYFILDGQVRVMTTDRAGRQVLLSVMERGDFFGEGSLFTGRPRSASVEALTVCSTLQVPRAEWNQHLQQAPTLREAIYRAHQTRQTVTALSRVPAFSTLTREEREKLASYLIPRSYPRHEVVIHEGDLDRSFFLITWGQAVAVQGYGTSQEQVLTIMEAGDFFGEMALLLSAPRSATVWALTRLEVFELPEAAFEQLLVEWPAMCQAIEQVIASRLQRVMEVRADRRMAQVLNQAVIRGEAAVTDRLLVRERTRCPQGCRRCEAACQSRFGRSRLHLDGVIVGYLTIPTACRHCLYPECVSACPVEALEWDGAGRLFVNERCHGCGRCARACPYGAIEMVQLTPEPHRGLLGRLLAGVLGREEAAVAQEPPLRAEKCDLCRDYPELACLSACPTGALKLVQVEEYFGVRLRPDDKRSV
jgi:CRP-like cAMP-binding protein/NAD-dependent dihydropyrimidine dehydrogenase PreA subunit